MKNKGDTMNIRNACNNVPIDCGNSIIYLLNILFYSFVCFGNQLSGQVKRILLWWFIRLHNINQNNIEQFGRYIVGFGDQWA